MYVRRYGANMRTDGQTDTHIQTPDTWYDFFRKKETNNNKKQTFAGTILKSGPSQTLVITAYNKLFPLQKLKGTLYFWFDNSQKFPVFLLTPRFDH